jgi:amidase
MDRTELAFAGAVQQACLLASGAVRSPELAELYLERISQLDPQLNAFRVVRAESARAEAVQAQRRLDGGERLPLLGVPIVVKDDVDVAGEVTTWGTSAYGDPAERDAEVVRRLREAGAIVLGKTNLPEMAVWPFTESPTFAVTRNPWDLSRSPGGSSGGSAAAVAAGLAAMAVGSDGGGSIRTPASWCGVFGLKPQRDRVPLSPHDDAWHGMLVYGPLTRTVEDAALFLDVTTTLPAPDGGFVAAARRDPHRLRVAITTKNPLGPTVPIGKAQQTAVLEAAALMRELGHDVIERRPHWSTLSAGWNVSARYLRGVHDDVAAMAHPDRLETHTRRLARTGGHISDRRIAKLRATADKIAWRVNATFDDVDVLITPGTAIGPMRVGAYQGRGVLARLNAAGRYSPFVAIFNATGQPAASVPWGVDPDGIPMSVQLVGRPADEATLLALSSQIETAHPWTDQHPPVS